MHDRERRCFKFDAPYSSRVIGERSIGNGRGHAVLHMDVKSTSGVHVHSSDTADAAPAKFAFVTPDYYTGRAPDVEDDYDYEPYELDASYAVCLTLSFDDHRHVDRGKRPITFWIRPDRHKGLVPEPKAKEGSLGTISVALQDMQESLRGMVNDLAALQQRERRLVLRTEATGSRLVLLAILSLVVIVATAALQFFHFKSYFKSKKLI